MISKKAFFYPRSAKRALLAFTAVSILLAMSSSIAWTQSTPPPEVKSQILGAVAMDFDRNTNKGSSLSSVGPVSFQNGFVGGKNAKSGWVNISAIGYYTDPATGAEVEIVLSGVSFWVNQGGKNWWDFEVKKAYLKSDKTKEVNVTAKIEKAPKGGNRPVVIVEGKYKLVAVAKSLDQVYFEAEKKPKK